MRLLWRSWLSPLHVAHLPVDALHDIVIHEEVGDDAELR